MEGVSVADFQVEEQMESIRKDAAERKEELDETMVRGKVETTLQRQGVMDWLAENSDLEVEFIDETFDENMMQQLADDSLKREEEMAAKNAAGAVVDAEIEQGKASAPVVDAVIEAKPVVEAKPVAVEEPEDEASKAEKYANLSLEERAYQILVDSGAVKVNKNPDDPDYDSSQDKEYL
jgi:hypothetical protein